MFESKQRGTVIAKGLKIVGSVTAEGLVEVNGQIDGELHCTSLVIARGAHVTGTVEILEPNPDSRDQKSPAIRPWGHGSVEWLRQ